MIEPSTSLTFLVISRPFSSTIIILLPHVTGYLPDLQSVGTVYVRENTAEPSSAVTLKAEVVSKAISSSAIFATTLAEYPLLSLLTSESAIPALPSTFTAPSIPATAISLP